MRALALVPVSSHAFVPDPDLGYRLAPGVFGLADGFRADTGATAAPDPLKILFIGDSFTFGTYPAPDDYPGRAGATLVDAGIDTVALNRGLTGAGTDTYVRLARRFVAEDDPDALVVTIYLGNDIHQSHPRQETGLLLGRLLTSNRTLAVGPHLRELHLYSALRLVDESVRLRMDARPEPLAPHPDEAGRVNGPMTDGQLRRTYRAELGAMRRVPSGFMREAEAGLIARLRQIRDVADGRPVLVVLAPSRIHADDWFARELLMFWDLYRGDYCFTCLPERLAEAVREAGLPVVDLTPAFARAEADGNLFNRADIHWNRTGNALAGRSIAEWIAANPAWLAAADRP